MGKQVTVTRRTRLGYAESAWWVDGKVQLPAQPEHTTTVKRIATLSEKAERRYGTSWWSERFWYDGVPIHEYQNTWQSEWMWELARGDIDSVTLEYDEADNCYEVVALDGMTANDIADMDEELSEEWRAEQEDD